MGLFARASRQGRSLLQTTPKYVRERIVFPYSRGLPLAREIRILGGTAALDEAFANPPRSTEQVLHPEKLLERRDDPIEIQLSDSWLPAGAQAIHEDTLGELGIRQLFNTRFPKDFAYPAAEGWGRPLPRRRARGARRPHLAHGVGHRAGGAAIREGDGYPLFQAPPQDGPLDERALLGRDRPGRRLRECRSGGAALLWQSSMGCPRTRTGWIRFSTATRS